MTESWVINSLGQAQNADLDIRKAAGQVCVWLNHSEANAVCNSQTWWVGAGWQNTAMEHELQAEREVALAQRTENKSLLAVHEVFTVFLKEVMQPCRGLTGCS